MSQCAVGDTASQGSSSRVAPDDENTLLGDDNQELTQFMLCRIKDRFEFWYTSRSVTVAHYHEYHLSYISSVMNVIWHAYHLSCISSVMHIICHAYHLLCISSRLGVCQMLSKNVCQSKNMLSTDSCSCFFILTAGLRQRRKSGIETYAYI